MENNTKGESKISMPVAIIVAGLLIMFGIIISKGSSKIVNNDVANNKQDVTADITLKPVSANDHVRGNINTAELVIVEFSDTECPWCIEFYPVLKQAMEKYSGKIAWVYRQSPIESLHSKARNESRATECVNKIKGNDTFWQYLDMIYENTPGNDQLDPNLLATYAEKVGVDKNLFNKCMVDSKIEFDKLIDESLIDGQNAGLKGTPHSIIITKDGTKIPVGGYLKEEDFNSTIDTILNAGKN